MTQDELLRIVREIKTDKIMRDELDDNVKRNEEKLKAYMTRENIEYFNIDVFKVSWLKTVINRFNAERFKERYLDLYREYTSPTESRRFTIT